jgi:hypothetical protein
VSTNVLQTSYCLRGYIGKYMAGASYLIEDVVKILMVGCNGFPSCHAG